MTSKSGPTTFGVGQSVEWISSGTKKTGVVIGVIPSKRVPLDMGYKVEGGLPRDHESYIVEGVKSVCRRGETRSRQVKSLYWPRVSLLRPLDTLTTEEINWCMTHPKEIRKLMATAGK